MATGTQTITSSQNPWVPPADFDIAHTSDIEVYSQGGAGQDGPGTGGGGGAYLKKNAYTVVSAALVNIVADSASAGFIYDGDSVAVANSGAAGASGGTGGGDLSDVPPDVVYAGGNGGAAGAVKGGGGGGAANSGGAGQNGAPDGGSGGGPGSGDGGGGSGGDGGNPPDDGMAGGIRAGGGGAGLGGLGGAAGTGAKVVITYTKLATGGLSSAKYRLLLDF